MAPTKSNKFAVCKYAEALHYDETRSKNLINATTYKSEISNDQSDKAKEEKQVKTNLRIVNKTEINMLKNQLQS